MKQVSILPRAPGFEFLRGRQRDRQADTRRRGKDWAGRWAPWVRLPLAMLALAAASCDRAAEDSRGVQPANSPARPVRPAAPVARVDSEPEAQQTEIHALRRRVAELEAELARVKRTSKPPQARSKPPPATAEATPAETPRAPPFGTTISASQRAELLTGGIEFSPGAIPPTGTPVDESTPLLVGQDLLLRWNETWYAANIIGFEPDGRVRVHYFGWSSFHDEIVPRSDLQLDPNARARAVDTTYPTGN